MNAFKTVMKILTALAAIAGVIYIIATYGDKIVAWAKKLLAQCPCKCNVDDCAECECEGECKCDCECACECETAEEPAPAEEAAPAEEVPAEEPIEEVVVEEGEPVADEADFAE
jgi:hypothetical protein